LKRIFKAQLAAAIPFDQQQGPANQERDATVRSPRIQLGHSDSVSHASESQGERHPGGGDQQSAKQGLFHLQKPHICTNLNNR
jgi:hypothetical protein